MRAIPTQRQTWAARVALAALISVSPLLAITLMPIAASHAATAQAASKCKIVIRGAHWSIREPGGRISGNKYTIVATGISCSTARPWVVRFTHQKIRGSGQTGLGQHLKGPSGFNCRSFSEAVSGDKRVYAGACVHRPHGKPSFGWAPKPHS